MKRPDHTSAPSAQKFRPGSKSAYRTATKDAFVFFFEVLPPASGPFHAGGRSNHGVGKKNRLRKGSWTMEDPHAHRAGARGFEIAE